MKTTKPTIDGDDDVATLKDTIFRLTKQLDIFQRFLQLKFGREFDDFLNDKNENPLAIPITHKDTAPLDDTKVIADRPPFVVFIQDDESSDNDKLVEEIGEKRIDETVSNDTTHVTDKPKVSESKSKLKPKNPPPRTSKIRGVPIMKNKAGNIICTLCDKEFLGPKASRNLRNHVEVHNTDRKYDCPHCPKKFSQKRPRRTHINRMHQRDKVLIHGCFSCEKKFCSPQELTTHERTHTGEKPFACDKCTYKCTQVHNLIRHQKSIHDHEKLICYQCGKSFASKRGLAQHEGKQHSSDPFEVEQRKISCDICQDRFVNKQALTKHLKTVHNIVQNIKSRPSRAKKNQADPEKSFSTIEVTLAEVELEEVPYA